MITKIGERKDGTLIGEDENGVMYVGTKRRAGWDEVQRTIIDNGDGTTRIEYKVGDYLISKGVMRTIPDAEMESYIAALQAGESPAQPSGFSVKYHGYVAQKQHISIPLPDGTNAEFERLIDVIEWSRA